MMWMLRAKRTATMTLNHRRRSRLRVTMPEAQRLKSLADPRNGRPAQEGTTISHRTPSCMACVAVYVASPLFHVHQLTVAQGRARPHRRVVSYPQRITRAYTYHFQVDSSDEDDESGSDVPRKRQRTASRKGMLFHQNSSRDVLIHCHSIEATHPGLQVSRL